MFIGSVDKKKYSQSMNNLKSFSKEFDSIIKALNEYEEKESKKFSNRLKKEGLAGVIVNSYYARLHRIKTKKLLPKDNTSKSSTTSKTDSLPLKSDYFSDKKIAVYTALFGKYDGISEPITVPDNCEFYIFTDQDIPDNSVWNIMDLSPYSSKIQSLTNTEKNRWFKMFPDVLFPDHEYSIYVDASILVITDLTEYINSLGKYGIGLFRHPCNCIYDECNRCVYYNKITKEEGKRQIDYLKSERMPENYGLCEGGVIVREHHSALCKKIMSEWWEAFISGPRRDQLSFTYILFKNNISCEDIYLPGGSIGTQSGIKLFRHN